MKIYAVNLWEAFLERLYMLAANSSKLRHLAFGYLAAIFIEIISESRNMGWPEANTILKTDFCTLSLYSIVFYLVIAFLLLSGVLQLSLKCYFNHKKIPDRVKALFKKYEDKIFKEYELDGIGWGMGHTLMPAPRIGVGWRTKDLVFEVDPTLFCFRTLGGEQMELDYQHYLKDEFPKKFTEDGDKYMLTAKPVAYTDANILPIRLRRVKWSQLQFFWQHVYPGDKARYIHSLFYEKTISHPNSFCLHLVVVTSDEKILITCASSHKTNDYPSSWAVSIGEQINREDISNCKEDCGYKWVARALYEELALGADSFLLENIHYLSVNVEGDIANCAFVCMVRLNISSEDLLSILATENRSDNEFQQVDFISFDDIPSELINPSRTYHPSAPMRMIDVYIHRIGCARLHDRLLWCEYKMDDKKRK